MKMGMDKNYGDGRGFENIACFRSSVWTETGKTVISSVARNLSPIEIQGLQIFPFGWNDKSMGFRSDTN